MNLFKTLTIAAGLAAALPMMAQAGEVIGSYVAYIGRDDLYNSKGVRLSEPAQILRQDRANYHRFGIRDAGDEWDGFFDDYKDRATMERMIRNGYISPAAARDIVAGGATVVVKILGHGSTGDSLHVDVYR